MWRLFWTLALAIPLLQALAPAVARAETLPVMDHAPPPGALKSGMKVLVDDGTCPSDQIKLIVAGDNVALGNSGKGGAMPRKVSCIPRP